jgi:hypothetical protein
MKILFMALALSGAMLASKCDLNVNQSVPPSVITK